MYNIPKISYISTHNAYILYTEELEYVDLICVPNNIGLFLRVISYRKPSSYLPVDYLVVIVYQG